MCDVCGECMHAYRKISVYMCIFLLMFWLCFKFYVLEDCVCVIEMLYGSVWRLNKLCVIAGVYLRRCVLSAGREV